MSDDIPKVDPALSTGGNPINTDRENLEFGLLEAETKLQNLVHREIRQRYSIKWIAVVTGGIVILGMAGVLWHGDHNLFWGPFIFANTAVSVSMIAVPIASITTITVALFVGAFRKFEEKDLESIGDGVSRVSSTLRGG